MENVIESNKLREALENDLWVNHRIGDTYSMTNVNKSIDKGWKIVYYPLFGTYKNGVWQAHFEPRALIEKGLDFREVPTRYLTKEKN